MLFAVWSEVKLRPRGGILRQGWRGWEPLLGGPSRKGTMWGMFWAAGGACVPLGVQARRGGGGTGNPGVSGVLRPHPHSSPSQTPHWLLRASCLLPIPAEDVVARGLFIGNRTCCSPVQNPSTAAHCLLGTVSGISAWKAKSSCGRFYKG